MQKGAEILKIDPIYPEKEKITRAANFIKKGKLVAFPTETVYGLGVDGLNKEGIRLIFEVKKRPISKPISLLISDFNELSRLAKDIPDDTWKLIDKFWPGPLTIILSASDLVPEMIMGEKRTVGIRMPDNKIALALIESSKTPIACPSANISGHKEPTTCEEVMAGLKDKIDLIIDGGKTKLGIASTVLDLTGKSPVILREGAIGSKELFRVLNSKNILFVCTGNTCRSFMAEKLFAKMAKETNFLVEVKSAGTSAINNGNVTPMSLKILENEGILPTAAFSTLLNEQMIKKANLILTMESYHKERVESILPSAKGKTFLLSEYVGLGKKEIADPIGGSREGYETCFLEIKKCLTRLIKKLME
ncbi:MAG: L-threonylcarbamoyladenylate synthase [bacterium]